MITFVASWLLLYDFRVCTVRGACILSTALAACCLVMARRWACSRETTSPSSSSTCPTLRWSWRLASSTTGRWNCFVRLSLSVSTTASTPSQRGRPVTDELHVINTSMWLITALNRIGHSGPHASEIGSEKTATHHVRIRKMLNKWGRGTYPRKTDSVMPVLDHPHCLGLVG